MREDLVDRLGEHLVAIVVEQLERLGIGAQNPGADPHEEPALQQVVEQGRLRRHHGRMAVRQVDHGGTELDLRGHVRAIAAMNIMLEGMFSATSVRCSPQKASL